MRHSEPPANLQNDQIRPAVLNQRLKELRAAGFVHNTSNAYTLTDLGRRTQNVLVPLSYRYITTSGSNLGDNTGSVLNDIQHGEGYDWKAISNEIGVVPVTAKRWWESEQN